MTFGTLTSTFSFCRITVGQDQRPAFLDRGGDLIQIRLQCDMPCPDKLLVDMSTGHSRLCEFLALQVNSTVQQVLLGHEQHGLRCCFL